VIDKTYSIDSVYLADADAYHYYEYELSGKITEIKSISMNLSYSGTDGYISTSLYHSQSTNTLPYSVVDADGVVYATISLINENVIAFTYANSDRKTCNIKDILITYKAFGYTQNDMNNQYNTAYDIGYNIGYSNGNNDGYANGKTDGIVIGKQEELNSKDTVSDLMYSIIDAPFNVLSNAFNFEFFGINLSSFLIAIVSLILVGFVIRKIM